MAKLISIAFFLFLFYRLVVNGGKFLKSNVVDKKNKPGEYVDYEEVDSKIKD